MKRLTVALAVGTLVASTAALAASDKKAAVTMLAAEMVWKDNAAIKGSQWTALWGDPAAGAWGALKKVPAGTELPAHTHTLDSKVAMMKGTITLRLDGMADKAMGPMSYSLIPGGMVHSASCGKDSECVYMEQMEGPYDFMPVAKK